MFDRVGDMNRKGSSVTGTETSFERREEMEDGKSESEKGSEILDIYIRMPFQKLRRYLPR